MQDGGHGLRIPALVIGFARPQPPLALREAVAGVPSLRYPYRREGYVMGQVTTRRWLRHSGWLAAILVLSSCDSLDGFLGSSEGAPSETVAEPPREERETLEKHFRQSFGQADNFRFKVVAVGQIEGRPSKIVEAKFVTQDHITEAIFRRCALVHYSGGHDAEWGVTELRDLVTQGGVDKDCRATEIASPGGKPFHLILRDHGYAGPIPGVDEPGVAAAPVPAPAGDGESRPAEAAPVAVIEEVSPIPAPISLKPDSVRVIYDFETGTDAEYPWSTTPGQVVLSVRERFDLGGRVKLRARVPGKSKESVIASLPCSQGAGCTVVGVGRANGSLLVASEVPAHSSAPGEVVVLLLTWNSEGGYVHADRWAGASDSADAPDWAMLGKWPSAGAGNNDAEPASDAAVHELALQLLDLMTVSAGKGPAAVAAACRFAGGVPGQQPGVRTCDLRLGGAQLAQARATFEGATTLAGVGATMDYAVVRQLMGALTLAGPEPVLDSAEQEPGSQPRRVIWHLPTAAPAGKFSLVTDNGAGSYEARFVPFGGADDGR